MGLDSAGLAILVGRAILDSLLAALDGESVASPSARLLGRVPPRAAQSSCPIDSMMRKLFTYQLFAEPNSKSGFGSCFALPGSCASRFLGLGGLRAIRTLPPRRGIMSGLPTFRPCGSHSIVGE